MNTGLPLMSEVCKDFITRITCHLFRVTLLKNDIDSTFCKSYKFYKRRSKKLQINDFEKSSYNEII